MPSSIPTVSRGVGVALTHCGSFALVSGVKITTQKRQTAAGLDGYRVRAPGLLDAPPSQAPWQHAELSHSL
jgi:hypothetical protein